MYFLIIKLAWPKYAGGGGSASWASTGTSHSELLTCVT